MIEFSLSPVLNGPAARGAVTATPPGSGGQFAILLTASAAPLSTAPTAIASPDGGPAPRAAEAATPAAIASDGVVPDGTVIAAPFRQTGKVGGRKLPFVADAAMPAPAPRIDAANILRAGSPPAGTDAPIAPDSDAADEDHPAGETGEDAKRDDSAAAQMLIPVLAPAPEAVPVAIVSAPDAPFQPPVDAKPGSKPDPAVALADEPAARLLPAETPTARARLKAGTASVATEATLPAADSQSQTMTPSAAGNPRTRSPAQQTPLSGPVPPVTTPSRAAAATPQSISGSEPPTLAPGAQPAPAPSPHSLPPSPDRAQPAVRADMADRPAAQPIPTTAPAPSAPIAVAPAQLLAQAPARFSQPIAMAQQRHAPTRIAASASSVADGQMTAILAGTATFVSDPALAAKAPSAAQQGALDLNTRDGMSAMLDRIAAMRDGSDARENRIRLMPDALGTVDVTVRRDNQGTHVHLTAENAAARTMLHDAAPRLTELADQRGLKLASTVVDQGSAQGGSAQGGSAQQGQPHGQQSQHHSNHPRANRAMTNHSQQAEALVDDRPGERIA